MHTLTIVDVCTTVVARVLPVCLHIFELVETLAMSPAGHTKPAPRYRLPSFAVLANLLPIAAVAFKMTPAHDAPDIFAGRDMNMLFLVDWHMDFDLMVNMGEPVLESFLLHKVWNPWILWLMAFGL